MKRSRRRASYRAGVRWIADNDEPTIMDPEVVAYFTTTLLLADLFGKEPKEVGRAIVRIRQKDADR